MKKQKAHLKDKTEGFFNFSDYKKTSFKIIYGIIIFLLIVHIII